MASGPAAGAGARPARARKPSGSSQARADSSAAGARPHAGQRDGERGRAVEPHRTAPAGRGPQLVPRLETGGAPVQAAPRRLRHGQRQVGPGGPRRGTPVGAVGQIEQAQHLADRGDAEQRLALVDPRGRQRPDQPAVHVDRRAAHALGHAHADQPLRERAGDDELAVHAPAAQHAHDLGGELLDRVASEDRAHDRRSPGLKLLGRDGRGRGAARRRPAGSSPASARASAGSRVKRSSGSHGRAL